MRRRSFGYAVIAILILALLAAALVYSLGGDGDTASVVLPTPVKAADAQSSADGSETGGVVSVNPGNVQEVVKSLDRSDDYSMQMRTSLYSSAGTKEGLVSIWTRDGSSRVIITGDEVVKNILILGDSFYIWYSDSPESVFSGSGSGDAGSLSERFSGIPDYTAVPELDPDDITDAFYDGGTGLITVICGSADGVQEKYEISAGTGLLAGFTRLENGETAYTMTAEISTPADADPELFELPD